MNKDIKTLFEAYTNLAINNTTRNTDSYAYAPKDYSQIRSENEEASIIQKRVAGLLEELVKKASRGTKGDYMYVASRLNEISADLSSLIKKL